MKKKILTICLALTMVFAMAACGGGSQNSDSSAVLRYGLTSAPESMNPIDLNELYAYAVVRQCYNGLTDRAADGSVTDGGLAESWTVSDDGTVYDFVLKQGVKFHSGAELTAKDVKYTFEQILRPEGMGDGIDYLSGVAGAQDIQDGKATELKGFEITGDYEFKITFDEPEFNFPEYCSSECLYIVDSSVVEGADANWWETTDAGTGPFVLKSFTADEKVELASNPDYFKGAPAIVGVDFTVVDDEGTQFNMYKNDELDVIDAPFAEIENIKSDDTLKDQLVEYPAADMTYLGMSQSLYEPFKDIRVRQAVQLVVSPDTIADKVLGGAAYPLYGVIPQDFCGFNSSLKAPEQNTEKALGLLKEAGYDESNPLPPISLEYLPMDEDNAVYIADQLKNELGWEVTLDGPDRSTMIDNLWEYDKYAFFIFGGTADCGDAGSLLSQFVTDAGRNFSLYSNEEFDNLMAQASTEADPEARIKLYQQAEQILVDDCAMIPMYVDKTYQLVKPNVSGLRFSGLGMDSLEDVTIE